DKLLLTPNNDRPYIYIKLYWKRTCKRKFFVFPFSLLTSGEEEPKTLVRVREPTAYVAFKCSCTFLCYLLDNTVARLLPNLSKYCCTKPSSSRVVTQLCSLINIIHHVALIHSFQEKVPYLINSARGQCETNGKHSTR
ncbi:hypothetical protein L9F63_007021, partial [Diploptera punctata]